MYAVIASGGKQEKVTEGQQVALELLDGDEGSEISLGDEVRDIAKAVFMRLRRGQFTPEQARKAFDILKKARRDIEDL